MREKTITGWKIFTHDWRSPIQRGPAVFDGTFPFTTPTTEVDESPAKCGAGWHFTKDMATAFKIAGMWPTGRPARVVAITADKWIERGELCRSAQITLQRLATPEEIAAGIRELSSHLFGRDAVIMTAEQLAWYSALGRPLSNPKAVQEGLQAALETRQLPWQIRQFETVDDAWNILDGWDAWDGIDIWGMWIARHVWEFGNPFDAWVARTVDDPWDVWNTHDARAALLIQYASRLGHFAGPPDLYTIGIRDAYMNGLKCALPTGPNELGYVLV